MSQKKKSILKLVSTINSFCLSARPSVYNINNLKLKVVAIACIPAQLIYHENGLLITVEMHNMHIMPFYPHLHVRKLALKKLKAKNISKKRTDVQISCHSNYETNVDGFNVFERTQKRVMCISDFIVNWFIFLLNEGVYFFDFILLKR